MDKLPEFQNRKIGVVFLSAFFGFFAHAGCFAALQDCGLRIDGYAGSSAGAIVAAAAAAGVGASGLREHLFARQPDIIIGSCLKSAAISHAGTGWLRSRFTPQRAYSLCYRIARHEQYLLQKRLPAARGIAVIELCPETVPPSPARLDRGRTAYAQAYDYTKDRFAKMCKM